MDSLTLLDQWNVIKKQTECKNKGALFKEREIFIGRMGQNIGFEQNGKGNDSLRPVLILKKFNNSVFWGVPLTKTQKRNKYYFPFSFMPHLTSVAILTQLRLFDYKRLERKIGVMQLKDYFALKKAILALFA